MPEQFTGLVEIQTDGGLPTITLEGNHAQVNIGNIGRFGVINIRGVSGQPVLRLEGDSSTLHIGGENHAGTLHVFDDNGQPTIRLQGGVGPPSGKLEIASPDFNNHLVLNRVGVGRMHVTVTNPLGLIIGDEEGLFLLYIDHATGKVSTWGNDSLSYIAYGANGQENVIIASVLDSEAESLDNNGFIGVYGPQGFKSNVFGSHAAAMYVDASGQGVVEADFIAASTIQANVKNFRIPHPEKAGFDIVYACVEGPEAAAYVRGTGRLVNGRSIISLPEHFTAIAVETTMTVQLTPRSATSKGLAVIESSLKGVVVQELFDGNGTYQFDYMVMAVRRGYEDYQPVRDSQVESAGVSGNRLERTDRGLDKLTKSDKLQPEY